MTDPTLSEVRSLFQKEMELKRELEQVKQRLSCILGFNEGTRKNRRDTITPENRKASFMGLKEKAYERGKTR